MKKILAGTIAILALSTAVYADMDSIGEFEPDYSRPTKNHNRIGVGLGIGSSSKLFKKEDNSVMPLPLLDIRYDDFYVEGVNIGYHAYKNDLITMSIFLDPLAGFPVEGDDMKKGYKHIDDRETQAMLGVKADFRLSNIDILGSALVQAGENGSKARLSLFRVISMDKFRVIPSAFISYYSADFTDYYFGVSHKEVVKNSGIAGSKINSSYDADGAFSAGIKLTGDYAINDRLSLLIFLGAERFSDEIKDSPIVENSTVYSAGVGAKYFF